jgi:hypothetical protein
MVTPSSLDIPTMDSRKSSRRVVCEYAERKDGSKNGTREHLSVVATRKEDGFFLIVVFEIDRCVRNGLMDDVFMSIFVDVFVNYLFVRFTARFVLR